MIDNKNQQLVDHRSVGDGTVSDGDGHDGSGNSVDGVIDAISVISARQVHIDIKNGHLMTSDELLEAERAYRAWLAELEGG